MTLLDRGTCTQSMISAPAEAALVDVRLPSVRPAAQVAGDEPIDEPVPAGVPRFSAAQPISRCELDALLADLARATESIVHELGDRLGVPGWSGVSGVSFSRAPFFSPSGIGPAVLYVPGPAPAPGRPFSVFAAFWRACTALRRERETLTRQDEREIAVRLLLSLSTLREEHA